MNANRFSHPAGFAIFCDDVREEVSGKITIVGAYGGEMTVYGDAPVTLPKLCGIIHFRFQPSNEVRPFALRVFKDTEASEMLIELKGDLPLVESMPKVKVPILEENPGTFSEIRVPFQLTPFVVEQNCRLKVRAYLSDDEIRLGSITILLAPTPVESDRSAL